MGAQAAAVLLVLGDDLPCSRGTLSSCPRLTPTAAADLGAGAVVASHLKISGRRADELGTCDGAS